MFTQLAHRLVVGLAVTLTASAVLAQGFRGFRSEDLFDPAVTTQQMERYATMLDLSAEQQAAALALLEAYHVEFDNTARPARDRIENLRNEARETRDRALWMEIGEARQGFQEEAARMEKDFLADVQSLLTPEQAETGWPRVERERRREQSIPRGVMSGERVDVIALVSELELTEEQRAPLADPLNQYELELDLALVKRNEVQDEFREEMRDMFRNGDQEGIADMFERGKQASTKVRDINNRFARQIQTLLPADAAATFADEVRRRSFPMIYRSSYADRVLETAAGFDDLAPEQSEQLGTIRTTFASSLSSLNHQMETTQVEMEESMTAERMGEMFRRGGENDAMRDLRRQRRDLESSTVDQIRQILTEEQAARLPERGERDGDDEGRRRAFGGRRGGPDNDRDSDDDDDDGNDSDN